MSSVLQYSLVTYTYKRIVDILQIMSEVKCLSKDKIVYKFFKAVVGYLDS